MRIKGWMGRADQTTKVRGMFVHPAQIAALVARQPYITRARLVVDNPEGKDRMILHVELGHDQRARAEAIEVSIRDVTKVRGEVAFHATGELPKDGKVIEDTRKPV
jgi:phenylacetate-CoA ligase